MKIFIVIPAFNEEKDISKVLRDLEKKGLPTIVVDDGSLDKTFKQASKFKNITLLRHRVNLGKGAAIKTGAQVAFKKGADAVVFMDGDGQHKVSDLDKFIEKLKRGYQVVFGARSLEPGVPLIRFLVNKMASVFINVLFSIYVSDLICGYRAITKEAFKKIHLQSLGYAVETEMVIKTKLFSLKYCEVPIETVYLDKVKGVTIVDAFKLFFEVIFWRIKL